MDFSLSKRIQKAPKPVSDSQPAGKPDFQRPRVSKNIFGVSGFASRLKMQKSLAKSYSEIKKVPVWKIDKTKEQEIFQQFFPDKTQKPFFRKPDVAENLRSWSKEKIWAKGRQKADLIEKIQILKKASGV
ncbi:MAG: hypothetical protein M1127_03395 [Patescibacteria group bacterium]|nr:hypothetical protein [Patescibacteria group bacterium]